VPTFRQVFESLDSKLPPLTAFVLDVSAWLKSYWYVIVGAAVGAWMAFVAFKKTPFGELTCHHAYLRAPVFGPLVRKIALARFSRTFATLIRSGVPIMATLDIVAETSGNRVISNAVNKSKESVRNGQLLSEPLGEARVFPPMVVRMIAIGEKTGALEALLEKIAEFYDGQVKAAIKALTSLIEPLLITFMGVIVGGVVLSVFLPILDVVGKLSGQK
jgi:type IV pilus assembly protein PilC